MAGIALILRYQWRASWRRFIRTRHRAQFLLTMLVVLGWSFVVILPPRLSRAAQELAAGRTTSMDAVLWVFCVLWLLVVAEGASISLTSRHLLTFPIDAGSLLGVRILSLFCSPVTQLIALASLVSLWPFFRARHTVLGGAAALLLFALAFALAMSVSHLLSVAESRRNLLVPAAIISTALCAFFFAHGLQGIEQPAAGVIFTPPHLVTALAVAATPSATFIPLITLLAISAPVCFLLFWSFRRSLFTQTAKRAEGRAAGSVLWFPGRFGGLIRKEQYYFRKLLDLWLGQLLVLAISVASLLGSPPPIVRQSIILIVFALNANVIMNCFGMDTAAELNRYAILPLRGREVLLAKNLGLAVIVAAQLALLILTAAWRSGPVEAGAETIEAAVLLLSHLAWGNMVAVAAPFKMQFYRLASGGAPLTAMAGVTIGSIPGLSLMVAFRLHSESPLAAMATAVILLLVIAAYLASLHYAGRSFEHRRHIIGERLS
jgi:hypothetical protein